MLLNVSSVIKAELDYSQPRPPKEMHEEMLKGLILSLGHVKEVKIGEGCLQVKLSFLVCQILVIVWKQTMEHGRFSLHTPFLLLRGV